MSASNQKPKCVIILSNKSSGSSILQRFITESSQACYVQHTRHFENETLYWTKAASVLGMPQLSMPDSEVPLPKAQARGELEQFLSANIDNYHVPEDDHELIFGGWKSLCKVYAPALLEKSPHHLYQKSVLELILEVIRCTPEVDFHLVGLIRNPMSTFYSAWSRWRSPPEVQQQVWLTAYQNLLDLKAQVGDRVSIVRYEDLVTDPSVLKPVFDFLGVPPSSLERRSLHKLSLERWKKDKHYGFSPSAELLALAERYGYPKDSLRNRTHPSWPLQRRVLRILHKSKVSLKQDLKAVRSSVVRLPRKGNAS